MELTFSRQQLQHIRLRHQGLSAASRADSASEVARRLVALQAQELPAARLAIHARARGIRQADIAQAREEERSFVLSWCLRGTLHLVAAEDIGWLLALCGAGAIRATNSRYQQLGLSEPIRERALDEIQRILSRDAALPRAELAAKLAEKHIPTAGQAIHHLVRFAALRGLVCLGPEIDGDLTYTLLADWLPAALQPRLPADPAAELARRYLAAYAPATLADFARWSGLGKRAALNAWAAVASECAAVSLPDGDGRMLVAQAEPLVEPPPASARFLPRYDNYLLAYARRDFMVAAEHIKKVQPGGGLIRACALINGQARASWKLETRLKRARLTIMPYARLSAGERALLAAEAEQLGAFLGSPLDMRVASA